MLCEFTPDARLDPELRVERADGLARLGDLLPPAADFFDTGPWFEILAATCLPPGERPLIEAVADARGTVLAVPSRRVGRRLVSLANFYTCRFGPPRRAADPAATAEAAFAWARGLRAGPDRPTSLLLEALDDPAPLRAGLRRAGWLTEEWPQFGNWFLPARGLSFDAYWAARDNRLRNTVERKARALARAHAVEIRRFDDAERAVAVYERVHALSWKAPEPHPDFMPTLIRRGLPLGAVRVGALLVDGEPAAAQVWVTWRRRATIFKLAYAEHLRRWSPGSLLTRDMMREALDAGEVDEIDFGCGDDAYKRDWTPERRQRWGLAAYDPTTLTGLAAAARNLVPRMLRRG